MAELNRLALTFVGLYQLVPALTIPFLLMGNLLYTIAVILIIIWLLGFLGVLGAGIAGSSLIHVLLVIAVIAIVLRLIQGRSV